MKKALLSVSAVLAVLAVNAQTTPQRVPLFEVFTSSTCPPCNAGNAVYENILAGKPKTDYVSVKYQQNFPGAGDPYATSETVSRRSSTYAINSIPRMEIDGGWDQNAQSFTQTLYDNYRAVAPQFTLTGAYYVRGNQVTAKIDYKALSTVPAGAKVYVAIVETQTIKNVKNNGETKFYNVVKKMMPSTAGTAITAITAGQTGTTTLTYVFPGSYRLPADGAASSYINFATEHSVEHFDSLKVVAWVQGTNKTVYQAANLVKIAPTGIPNVSNTVGTLNVFPNPATNVLNLDITMKETDVVTAVLYDITGNAVSTQKTVVNAGKGMITMNTQSLAAGIYNVVLFDSNNNSFSQRISVTH